MRLRVMAPRFVIATTCTRDRGPRLQQTASPVRRTMKIWFRVHGRPRGDELRRFLAGLRSRGIHIERRPRNDPGGMGIVFFIETGPALLRLVASASDAGRHRLLACASGSVPPPSTAVWELLEAGASDVIPLDPELERCAQVAARLQRWEVVDELLRGELVRTHFVGTSPAWIKLLRTLIETARFAEAPVLLLGETGTGKELASRLVHAMDPRRQKGRLVVVECSSLHPGLAGSELFGHERGAFTGAAGGREGAVALAHRGSLFLDEIGDLNLELQAMLLRVLQEKTYRPIGSNTWARSDFRLIAATHRDLRAMVDAGAFRADLYHRIAGCECVMPPLRMRRDDVLPLARHFLAEAGLDMAVTGIDESVESYLNARDYPGNIRDLRQLCHGIAVRHAGPGPITAGDIREVDRPGGRRPAAMPPSGGATGTDLAHAVADAVAEGLGLRDLVRRVRIHALDAAEASEGSLARAARRLHVTSRALQKLRRALTGGG